MGKVTYVVEYEDGKEPPVHADMDVMGGKLAAVSWSDYRDGLLTERELENVQACIDASEWIPEAEFVQKLRLLTR